VIDYCTYDCRSGFLNTVFDFYHEDLSNQEYLTNENCIKCKSKITLFVVDTYNSEHYIHKKIKLKHLTDFYDEDDSAKISFI